MNWTNICLLNGYPNYARFLVLIGSQGWKETISVWRGKTLRKRDTILLQSKSDCIWSFFSPLVFKVWLYDYTEQCRENGKQRWKDRNCIKERHTLFTVNRRVKRGFHTRVIKEDNGWVDRFPREWISEEHVAHKTRGGAVTSVPGCREKGKKSREDGEGQRGREGVERGRPRRLWGSSGEGRQLCHDSSPARLLRRILEETCSGFPPS